MGQNKETMGLDLVEGQLNVNGLEINCMGHSFGQNRGKAKVGTLLMWRIIVCRCWAFHREFNHLAKKGLDSLATNQESFDNDPNGGLNGGGVEGSKTRNGSRYFLTVRCQISCMVRMDKSNG